MAEHYNRRPEPWTSPCSLCGQEIQHDTAASHYEAVHACHFSGLPTVGISEACARQMEELIGRVKRAPAERKEGTRAD